MDENKQKHQDEEKNSADSISYDGVTSGNSTYPSATKSGTSNTIISNSGQTQDTVVPDMINIQALSDMQVFTPLEESRKKKKNKRTVMIVVSVIVALLLIGGISAWFIMRSISEAMQQMPATTSTVTQGTFTAKINATGTLEPLSSVSVTPEIDGIVSEVSVAEGDTVDAGQTLFTINNDSLDQDIVTAEQAVKTASNSVDQAYASYTSAVDSYNSAIDTYNRAKAAGDASAVFDKVTLQNAINSAEIGVDSANISLETAQKTLDAARKQGDKRTVTAPISGSVLQMNVKPGISLSSLSSSQKAACQIADASAMSMTLQINEIDIAQVAVGQKATVKFDSLPDLFMDATVTRIASTSTSTQSSSAGTGVGVVTYSVDLALNGTDARLKPGMSASATITTKSLENALMVPRTAVQTADDGSTYIVIQAADFEKTGIANSVHVTVTTRNDTTAVIEGDVKAGDTVLDSVLTSQGSPTDITFG